MPVIASATLSQIRGFDNGRIEVIKKEIQSCGCLSTTDLSTRLKISQDELKPVIGALMGSGSVVCDSAQGICCADAEKLREFTDRLTRIRASYGR